WRALAFSGCCRASAVRRIAVTTRPAIGLECVVRSAIRLVTRVAPFHMRVVATVNLAGRLAGDYATDDGARYEGCRREPVVSMPAIAWPVFPVTAMAAP